MMAEPMEQTLLRLDGSRFEAEVQGAPVHDADGPLMLVSIRDISARKRAELAVVRADLRLRGIVESATDAILTIDATQHIVQANAAAAVIFKWPLDRLLGAPLEHLMPQRYRQQHRQEVTAFGNSVFGARQMGRERIVWGQRADGSEFPIDASISHLSVAGERLYTVILRDITERVRAEAELRAGKSTLEAALSAMSDAVFITDDAGRLLAFNEAFASVHRFKDKASCLTRIDEFPALFDARGPGGEELAFDQWAVPRALRGETATHLERIVRRKDTGESWVASYSFAPIRTEGAAIVGAVVTVRDVTEQKRAQAELEASHSELQRLFTAYDRVQEEERIRISRELHDDLQQTLAAIQIDLGSVAASLASDPDAAAAQLAQIGRLATAAIISTRRIVNDLRPQMLEDLGLVPALQLLAGQFTQRCGVACHVSAKGDIEDGLALAPRLGTCLYRVTQEALNNVAKHAQASQVWIVLSRTPDTQLSLRITDDGRGMRVDAAHGRESFGVLGMRERARAVGGTLHVDSAPDGGTTVELRVPTPSDTATSDALADLPGAALTFDGNDPRASDRSVDLQSVIDALDANVAVLDAQGVIRLVNRAWHDFATHNGAGALEGLGPGVDYLAVCRRSASHDESAAAVLAGLTAVLEGRQPAFATTYPCNAPDRQRWFRMHVKPLPDGGLLVTHFDLGA
jgi:PAS domain S-box-containing protein